MEQLRDTVSQGKSTKTTDLLEPVLEVSVVGAGVPSPGHSLQTLAAVCLPASLAVLEMGNVSLLS